MTSGVTDLVADAAAELYGADPASFMARRTALADAARLAGDAAAAKEIAALRKPTRPAWVLNTLVRASPDVPGRLAELASSLRSAAESADGVRLRELSAQRSSLVDSLARQALSVAGLADPPGGLREDVVATLDAALADPEVAARFAAGALTRAEHWAGFGEMVVPPPGAAPTQRAPAARSTGTTRPAARAPATGKRRAPSPAPLEDKERENRRRQATQDAERQVANAAVTAASAASAESELEDAVRDLEQRLTATRAELAAARLKARRAEAAERKARQALDRVRRGLLVDLVSQPYLSE